MNERHHTKTFQEATKDTCRYCHRTPPSWQQIGSEKICAHCGTRVSLSVVEPVPATILRVKSA